MLFTTKGTVVVKNLGPLLNDFRPLGRFNIPFHHFDPGHLALLHRMFCDFQG